MYILDLARLLPSMPLLAEDYSFRRTSYLTEFFRAEALSLSARPLSSDAYSAFVDASRDAAHRADAEDLMRRVLTERVPMAAGLIVQQCTDIIERAGVDPQSDVESLVSLLPSLYDDGALKLASLLHCKTGVNVRLLGNVWQCLGSEDRAASAPVAARRFSLFWARPVSTMPA
jgi:hypothetical protein